MTGLSLDEIIECCDDKKYAKFLNFVANRESRSYPISNIGTILNRVPFYSNYEQLFSAGIDSIIDTSDKFKFTIGEIPKGLIKLCQKKKIKLSNRFLNYYKQNQDAHLLAYNLEYLSLNDDDIYSILTRETYDRGGDYEYSYYSYVNKLLNEYGYTAKALFTYLDQLKTFEALDNVGHAIQELYDYAKMMKTISPKFDKYPRHFLTTHKIACRNYNRLLKEFSEEVFKSRIDKNLEYTYKDYCFIYPNSTTEIKEEAVQQNNCVASYIDNVIDGNCHILFLRKKNSKDESLVTLEIRNNQIVQAKRKFNDPVTAEDQEAIDKWNEKYSNKNEKEKAA